MRHKKKESCKSNIRGNYVVSLDCFFCSCGSSSNFSSNFVPRKKCSYLEFSGPYFPVFGLNTDIYGPEKLQLRTFSPSVVDRCGLLWVVVCCCGALVKTMDFFG